MKITCCTWVKCSVQLDITWILFFAPWQDWNENILSRNSSGSICAVSITRTMLEKKPYATLLKGGRLKHKGQSYRRLGPKAALHRILPKSQTVLWTVKTEALLYKICLVQKKRLSPEQTQVVTTYLAHTWKAHRHFRLLRVEHISLKRHLYSNHTWARLRSHCASTIIGETISQELWYRPGFSYDPLSHWGDRNTKPFWRRETFLTECKTTMTSQKF